MIEASYGFLAPGGLYSNGLALRLPVARDVVAQVTRSVGGGDPETLTPSTEDTELVAQLLPNLLFTGSAPHDVFIFRSVNFGRQVHQLQYGGTAAMDATIFGTADDASTNGPNIEGTSGTSPASPRDHGDAGYFWERSLNRLGASFDSFYPIHLRLEFATSARNHTDGLGYLGGGQGANGWVSQPTFMPRPTRLGGTAGPPAVQSGVNLVVLWYAVIRIF